MEFFTKSEIPLSATRCDLGLKNLCFSSRSQSVDVTCRCNCCFVLWTRVIVVRLVRLTFCPPRSARTRMLVAYGGRTCLWACGHGEHLNQNLHGLERLPGGPADTPGVFRLTTARRLCRGGREDRPLSWELLWIRTI